MKAIVTRRAGFTLVELLIVIVVIAILAAISIIAYNGIQQRAEEARIAAAVDSYYKVFEAAAVTNGSYPDLGDGCLGIASDYPAESPFTSGACVMVNGTTNSTLNSSLLSSLSSNISSLPSAKVAPVRVSFGPSQVYDYRGIWVSTHPTYFEFQYWLPGNKNCPRGTTSYNSSANATVCNLFWGSYS